MNWQLFSGGRIMFWVALIFMFAILLAFISTYVIDPMKLFYYSKILNIDASDIKNISEAYVASLGVVIDEPIVYRYVKYKDEGFNSEPGTEITLGTFHRWNNKYYIDISIDLRNNEGLEDTVIHETRHLLVEYMRSKNVINLSKYTEEIAKHNEDCYNDLFNSGVYLLKTMQEKEDGHTH